MKIATAPTLLQTAAKRKVRLIKLGPKRLTSLFLITTDWSYSEELYRFSIHYRLQYTCCIRQYLHECMVALKGWRRAHQWIFDLASPINIIVCEIIECSPDFGIHFCLCCKVADSTLQFIIKLITNTKSGHVRNRVTQISVSCRKV